MCSLHTCSDSHYHPRTHSIDRTSANATHYPDCGGTRIDHRATLHHQSELVDGPNPAAYVNVFYSSANGGTNCVKVNLAQGHEGATHRIYVRIVRCNSGNPDAQCVTTEDSTYTAVDTDDGHYKQYGGPVHVGDTAGKCIAFRVHVWKNGTQEGYQGTDGTGAFCQ